MLHAHLGTLSKQVTRCSERTAVPYVLEQTATAVEVHQCDFVSKKRVLGVLLSNSWLVCVLWLNCVFIAAFDDSAGYPAHHALRRRHVELVIAFGGPKPGETGTRVTRALPEDRMSTWRRGLKPLGRFVVRVRSKQY